MSNWLMRMAVVYLTIGVALGIGMGASQNFALAPLHAHLNLLGFVVMMLAGLWFRAVPAAASGALARAYFWIHQVVYPVQMLALFLFLGGNTAIDTVLALTSALMGLAILCLALNVWGHTKA